jgi:hypothetical protein
MEVLPESTHEVWLQTIDRIYQAPELARYDPRIILALYRLSIYDLFLTSVLSIANPVGTVMISAQPLVHYLRRYCENRDAPACRYACRAVVDTVIRRVTFTDISSSCLKDIVSLAIIESGLANSMTVQDDGIDDIWARTSAGDLAALRAIVILHEYKDVTMWALTAIDRAQACAPDKHARINDSPIIDFCRIVRARTQSNNRVVPTLRNSTVFDRAPGYARALETIVTTPVKISEPEALEVTATILHTLLPRHSFIQDVALRVSSSFTYTSVQQLASTADAYSREHGMVVADIANLIYNFMH